MAASHGTGTNERRGGPIGNGRGRTAASHLVGITRTVALGRRSRCSRSTVCQRISSGFGRFRRLCRNRRSALRIDALSLAVDVDDTMLLSEVRTRCT